MKETALQARLRAAVERYGMLNSGDRVAVGVSGGKDSLALLCLLAALRRYLPVPFSLTAITVDPCFGGKPADFSAVAALCERLQVPYIVKQTSLADVIFEQRQEANPCSLCARMRRGLLHRAAKEADCNVVALGHHRDDAAQTVLMNLFGGGEFSCFSPKSYLDRQELWLIRPMIFLTEAEIAAYAEREALPVVASACPVNGTTRRARTDELLQSLRGEYGDVADRLIGALQKSGTNGW